MEYLKSKLPQIILSLRKGEILKVKVKCSKDSFDVFKKIWDKESIDLYESMICLFFNRANNTIGWLKVSQGGLTGTLCDVKLILATAINCAAAGIILAHNHPSGNMHPSESDSKITKKLSDACTIMDIQLLDHLILSGDDNNDYYSFADNGIL